MVLKLQIRPATADDAGPMAKVLNAIVRTGGTTAIESLLDRADMIEWFIASPRVICCHVALATTALLGFQSVGRDPHLPDGWREMATFTAAGQTGKGIARALFAATVPAARRLGLHHLNAKIRADNVAGLAYYSSMGFVDDRTDVGVPLRDGRPVDRISKRFGLG